MVWSVTVDYSIAWPLEVVDLLQQNGAGLFTEPAYQAKRHKKSELHLVLIRVEAEKKGMIYAMLPDKDGKLFVTRKRASDKGGTEAIGEERRISRARHRVEHRPRKHRLRLLPSSGASPPFPAPRARPRSSGPPRTRRRSATTFPRPRTRSPQER
jgi:hypothetical protein